MKSRQVRLNGINAIDPYLIDRQKRLPVSLDSFETAMRYTFIRIKKLKMTVAVLEKSLSPVGLEEYPLNKKQIKERKNELKKVNTELDKLIKRLKADRVKLPAIRAQWAQIEAEDKEMAAKRDHAAKRKLMDETAELKSKRRETINGVHFFRI